jgi:hypothetical protein
LITTEEKGHLMHNRHLAGCAVMLAVALGFLVVTGGSSAGLGLVLVALVCPLAMILGVKLLLGDHQHTQAHPVGEQPPAEQADPSIR